MHFSFSVVLYFSLPFTSVEMVFTLCLKTKAVKTVPNQDTESVVRVLTNSQAYYRKNKDLPILDIKWLGFREKRSHCDNGGIVYTSRI